MSTASPAERWTAEQRRAIETRDVSVSLSAGAGCGKTFVLTHRYLAYFSPTDPGALKPEELHNLVAITFTERAAREMRDRIRKACYDELLHAQPGEVAYWSELVRGLDSARISTIHSFCSALLRSHAVEAGLDPQFEVLEQAQAETLLSEVIDDELRQLVAQRDSATIELATQYDLYALKDLMRTIVVESRDEELAHWLAASPEEQVARWAELFKTRVVPSISRHVADSEPAQRLLKILHENEPDHPQMRLRRALLLERLPLLKSIGEAKPLAAELEIIREHAKVQGAGSARHWDDPADYERFKCAAEKIRNAIDADAQLLTFDPAKAREAAVKGQQLLAIAAGARRRYAERKAALATLDFDDLLARARTLLVDPPNEALRRRMAAQIDLLLVDEFQDTDQVQIELVKALCGEALSGGKLFFVGDVKQSIYRFRGADPDVFRRLREETPRSGRLSLTTNFRSQPAILEFVNALFWHDLGSEYEALRPHRQQATPRPAVEFLWAHAGDNPPKETVGDMRRREAEWIARRIREMLDGGEPLVGELDPDRPGHERTRTTRLGDIAILFRALSDVEIYEAALRDHGIDYYLVGGHAFYAQQEIFDLLNLLRAVVSPSDGFSLAGVSRSAFFSLRDETLFWLSQHSEGLVGGLFAEPLPPQIDPNERARVAYAAGTMRTLRNAKDRLRICELIELAMSLTGYDATLLAEFLGERKLANLRKVIEQARSFERDGAFDLTDFIAELNEFVARQPKEPLAATFSEDTDVVRLMTIHQAKGLEFPVVFVPDVGRATETRSDRVRFDAELGPLLQAAPEANGNRTVGGYELWRFLDQQEDLAEAYRLLYVATTRAADYLVLSHGGTQAGDPRGAWMQLLARRFDLLTGELIGELPAEEPRPVIRVTTTAPREHQAASTRRKHIDLEKLAGVVEFAAAGATSEQLPIGPIEVDLAARRFYSFSRLNGTIHRDEPSRDVDEPARAGAVDPLGLGTLVHAVLAEIDFAEPADWRQLVEVHAERQLLGAGSPEALEAARLIDAFLQSPRAKVLAACKTWHAEAEFLLAWPIDGNGPPRQLLAGYIDRLYQDNAGAWHVIDFKTNNVSAGNVAQVAANYEMQMLVYALAAERSLHVAPQSVVLHFLRGGYEHPFAWNEAARRRAVELVDAGIQRALTAPDVSVP